MTLLAITPERIRSCALHLTVGALFSACASYPEKTSQALRDFQEGHFEQALAAYSDPEELDSSFLSGAESGTVALTAGDWDQALACFHRAVESVRDIEGRALAGGANLGEALTSWAFNDTVKAYVGEGFERVYVHCFLAMAYLAQGRVDDVYVEARLSNQLLESEEELYQREYAAGGWGHFISAVTYELIGQPDQAYIDYQRMVEKGVGTTLAGRALVRLASALGRSEELPGLVERHGPDIPRPDGAASVVVLGAVGLGPFKVESRMTLPLPEGFFQMAVPAYQARPQPVSGLRLLERESGQAVLTDTVERVTEVAAENLKDRLLWIGAKSAARGLLKRELTKELEEQYDTGGRILGDLYTMFSERADLRAWLTLPDNFQACRLFVPPGVHGFTLEAVGGESADLGSYELERGETLLVFARTLGTRLHAQVIGGRPVDGSEPAAATMPPQTKGQGMP